MLRGVIGRAREELIAAGIGADEAALDAELLVRHALGWDRATLVARLREAPPPQLGAALPALLERRRQREPMAYILGVQEFWGRDFVVRAGVLIPRPETELLVEEALGWLDGQAGRPSVTVLDVGTGSGCLAVTLALERTSTVVHATDISPAALAVARENASRLHAQVQFHQAPLLGELSDLALIVVNPPYVTRAEYERLQPEVRDFEPLTALVGGDDGLEIVRAVVQAAAAGLSRGGRLLMEIGAGQADAARTIVAEAPQLVLAGIRSDLQGTPRTVIADRR